MDSRRIPKTSWFCVARRLWWIYCQQIANSDLINYIKNQREHHHKKTFQEEYLELLKKHGVDYDERYLWN